MNKGDTATPGFGLPGAFGIDYQFIDEAAVDIYVDENEVILELSLCGEVYILTKIRSTCSASPSCSSAFALSKVD